MYSHDIYSNITHAIQNSPFCTLVIHIVPLVYVEVSTVYV